MPSHIAVKRLAQCTLLLAGLVVASLWAAHSVRADGLVLRPDEIRDILERAIQNNRSPEDIQQDLDGLNQARGGSGSVPLPYDVLQVETRDGQMVTVTRPEAARYTWAKEEEQDIRRRERDYSSRLDQFWADLEGLRASKDEPLLRWGRAFLAMNHLAEVQTEFEENLKLIGLERVAINRKPDRMVYGEAYENYDTYAEALNAWQNRDEALKALDKREYEVREAYFDRLKGMTDPDETDLSRTSYINRPDVLIRMVNDSIDRYQNLRTTTRRWIDKNEELMRGLERRAANQGGPPVSAPPVIKEPPTEDPEPPIRAGTTPPRVTPRDADTSGTSGGGRDADSSATPGGGATGGTGGDGDTSSTSGGTTAGGGGSAGGASGGGGGQPSLADLLKELGADEDKDTTSRPRTELVNEELLAGIQAEFDAAAAEYEDCSGDFMSQLQAMAGRPEEEICRDPRLASAYSCAEYAYATAADAYARAHSMLRKTDPSFNWEEMVMESELEEGGRVSAMDQITIILINSNYDKIAGGVERMRAALGAAAPGCSPDDLIRSGTQAGGGSGDGTGTGGSSGGGTGGGTGDGTGGGGSQSGYYFVKIGSPQTQSGGNIAVAGGCRLEITPTSEPWFPDKIYPGEIYRVSVPIRWSASFFDLESAEVVVTCTFLDPANIDLNRSSSGAIEGGGNWSSSFRYFRWTTERVDFNMESGVISVSYGGSIDCKSGSASTGGTVITQAYRRAED